MMEKYGLEYRDKVLVIAPFQFLLFRHIDESIKIFRFSNLPNWKM